MDTAHAYLHGPDARASDHLSFTSGTQTHRLEAAAGAVCGMYTGDESAFALAQAGERSEWERGVRHGVYDQYTIANSSHYFLQQACRQVISFAPSSHMSRLRNILQLYNEILIKLSLRRSARIYWK
jgi:hypothetical protein